MPKILFYITDINYKVDGDKAVVQMYSVTQEGKKILVLDDKFVPYFYVMLKPGIDAQKFIEIIKGTKAEDAVITNAEIVKREYYGEMKDIIKIEVNLPKGVPILADQLKQRKEVHEVLEYDILFVRRYLIDKNLIPFAPIEAEGEAVNYRSRVSAFKITSINQVSTEMVGNVKVMAVDLETYSLTKEIMPEQNPILMIGIYVANTNGQEELRKVLTWKEFKTDANYIEFLPNEASIIARFQDLIDEIKPNIIVGYYSDVFDLPYIKIRAEKLKIKFAPGLDFSEIRLQKGGRIETAAIQGIPHIDIYKFIRHTMMTSLQTDVYTLDAVASELIGENKESVDLEQLAPIWDNEPQKLEPYCYYNLRDSIITFRLFEKLMPNMLEMVKIIGLPMFDITRMGFSQLVEWFLIRQSFMRGGLVPDKPMRSELGERLGQTYQGAFVVQPTPGFYKDIVVFDFRSLYPTIIGSHNISPDTLKCDCCRDEAKRVPIEGKNIWFCEKRKGFVSSLIEEVITRRARITEMLKQDRDNGNENQLLQARRETLKILANSFYGYLGFNASRWYSIECAESVTALARSYLNKVITEAEKAGFSVAYGDTDSIFLLLNGKSKDDALKFAEKINFTLPGLMELDLEDFYPSGIFVQTKDKGEGAKKKYALLSESGKVKIRGFETVRRNWSFIAKEVQEKILNIILREEDAKKAYDYVKGIIGSLRDHKIDTSKVIIFTQLQKEIEDYDSVGPHVAVAQRMKNKGMFVGPGSMIKYVVTVGKGNIGERARLPDEVENNEYDSDYYINNQIIPSVERIFEAFGYSPEDLVEHKEQSKLDSFFR